MIFIVLGGCLGAPWGPSGGHFGDLGVNIIEKCVFFDGFIVRSHCMLEKRYIYITFSASHMHS